MLAFYANINIYAQRLTKEWWQIPGITDRGLQPKKVNKVAITGGGSVGCEIATNFILSNFYVILKESNEISLVAAIGEIKGELKSFADQLV